MAGSLEDVTLLMPDSVSPAAVAYDGEFFYAVNGLDARVFVFASDGRYIDSFRTVRAYRTARYSNAGNAFCCVGAGCRSGIYLLNGRFEETAYVPLESGSENQDRYICDAALSETGDAFEVTKRDSLELYARNGEFITTAARAGEGREFALWAQSGGVSAVYYYKNGMPFLTVDGEGGVLPGCTKMRSFITQGGNIYGAFSEGYLYTKTGPVYGAGVISRKPFGANAAKRGCV